MNKPNLYLLLGAALTTWVQSGVDTTTDVDLELSLLIDVSSSVDNPDYTVMMEGIAQAFASPSIHAAIATGPLGAIAVNMVQFEQSNSEVIDFTLIDGSAASIAFASTVRNVDRFGEGGTGVAQGISASVASFVDNGFNARRHVIDLSGDGEENQGGDVAGARDAALAGEIDTINAISVDDPDEEVRRFFEENAIGGPGAFATSAETFEEFQQEILEKLNAEIRGVPLTPSTIPIGAIRSAALLVVNGMFEDVNGRLFRARAGFREPTASAVAGSWSEPAGGGVEKQVLPPPPGRKAWEVFGSVGIFHNDVDAINGRSVAGAPIALVPGYELTMVHGTVGVEYDLAEHYSLGAAFLAANGDIDTDAPASDIDVESLGVAIYGTYFREDVFRALGAPFQGDYWADVLYAFQNTEFDVKAGGSAEVDTHRIEFNTGFNFRHDQFTHGPVGGLVWSDGDIDPSGGGTSTNLESLATRLGYQASYRMPTGVGDVIPQVRASWEHEFEDDAVLVGGVNIGEPDADKAVLGAGVLWHFHENFYGILDYEARLGDTADSHNVVLRVGGIF